MNSSNTGKIIKIGIPLLAGNLSFYLLQVADTIMVGRLGTESLGAIAFAGLFTGILMTFIWPVSVGVQALSSRRFGMYSKNNTDSSLKRVGNTLDNGIVTGISVSIVSFAVSFSAPFWFSILISDKALIPLALSYIKIIRWALPLGGIMMGVFGFLSGIRMTGYVMAANVGGSVINIFLNYVFIFGKFGFPELGIAGAALGTVLSEFIQVVYIFSVVLFTGKLKKYRTLGFRKIDLTLIKNIYKVFIPLLVQNIFALAVFLVYESIVGRIGTVYLAATHVIFSIFRINKTLVGGFARSSAILIGNAFGAGEKEKAVDIIHSSAWISAIIGSVILAVLLVSPGKVVSVFTKDPRVLSAGIRAVYFFSAFFFIEVMGYTLEIIFGGTGWGRYVLLSETSTNIVFIIGASLFFLAFFPAWGVYGAWTGFALYQIGHAVILYIGYLSGKWLHVEVESA